MENTVLSFNNTCEPSVVSQFSKLTNDLAQIIISQNINVSPCTPKSLEYLATLDLEKIKIQNSKLIQHIAALENATSFKDKTDNKSIIKNVLDFMKFTAPADFIDKIKEDDIVEIYNLEGIQIFRNLKFYETTTYGLTDLLTHEWFELYYRSSKITEKLMMYAEQVFENPSNDIVYEMDEVPVHMIKEIKADPIQLCEIKFKNIAPVINYLGQKTGLIVNCEAKSMLSIMDQAGIDFI